MKTRLSGLSPFCRPTLAILVRFWTDNKHTETHKTSTNTNLNPHTHTTTSRSTNPNTNTTQTHTHTDNARAGCACFFGQFSSPLSSLPRQLLGRLQVGAGLKAADGAADLRQRGARTRATEKLGTRCFSPPAFWLVEMVALVASGGFWWLLVAFGGFWQFAGFWELYSLQILYL